MHGHRVKLEIHIFILCAMLVKYVKQIISEICGIGVYNTDKAQEGSSFWKCSGDPLF